MLQNVEDILQPKALMQPLLMSPRIAIIPKGKNFVYQRNVFDSSNINSAIEYYIQVDNFVNKELRTKLNLVAQIVREPCFDHLRTKEQLGKL
jgi:insulysin